MKEIWKPIEDYEDYLISNYGRIISFKNKFNIGVILKPDNNKGYYYVNLYKKGFKRKKFRIHRTVAKTFIQNPDNLSEVNHKDENKLNNYVNNLEWCTSQYNNEYSKAKEYKILFPDDHIEIIYNLQKFCREYDLCQAHMCQSFKKGYFHQGYKILEIIERNGNTKKSKESYRKIYEILCPDSQIQIIYNLSQFCEENNLNVSCMFGTLRNNYFHKEFKLIKKINKNGSVVEINI